jgi:hypothetical protein
MEPIITTLITSSIRLDSIPTWHLVSTTLVINFWMPINADSRAQENWQSCTWQDGKIYMHTSVCQCPFLFLRRLLISSLTRGAGQPAGQDVDRPTLVFSPASTCMHGLPIMCSFFWFVGTWDGIGFSFRYGALVPSCVPNLWTRHLSRPSHRGACYS